MSHRHIKSNAYKIKLIICSQYLSLALESLNSQTAQSFTWLPNEKLTLKSKDFKILSTCEFSKISSLLTTSLPRSYFNPSSFLTQTISTASQLFCLNSPSLILASILTPELVFYNGNLCHCLGSTSQDPKPLARRTRSPTTSQQPLGQPPRTRPNPRFHAATKPSQQAQGCLFQALVLRHVFHSWIFCLEAFIFLTNNSCASPNSVHKCPL